MAAVGDLTHDHRSDVLTAKDLDGSGGCGWWRVLQTDGVTVRVLYQHYQCDGGLGIRDGRLEIDESVIRKGCDTHGCEGIFRRIRSSWDGRGFRVVSDQVLRGYWGDFAPQL